MKKFKEFSPTTKGFLVLIILLIIGIVIRWSAIKEETKRGFGFFGSDNEPTEQTENHRDSVN